MKKVFSTLSVLFFAFIVVNLSAQGQAAKKKALLWKISGNGLEQESYLYGTIHIICADQFFITDAAKEAFKKSEKLVLELDMDDPQMMAKAQQLSVNEGMANIKDELSEEDAKKLDEYLVANYGAGLAQYGILKPFTLTSLLLMSSFECETKQYEAEFVNMAKEQEIEIEGLETVEFQIGLFDQLPRQEQLDALIEQVDDISTVQDMMAELSAAYAKQDVAELYSLLEKYEDFKGFNDMFLHKRNQNWVAPIAKYAKEGTTFIAVGSGHLGSKYGVIALLREAGYTVEPVK